MKRALNISLGLVILVGILASSHHSSKLADAQNSEAVSKRDVASEVSVSDEKASALPFEKRFRLEADRVGKIDDSGLDLNKELAAWVQDLSPQDLQLLKVKSLNSKEAGDERGLAIFALAKSESVDSLNLLQQVALTEIPKQSNPKIFELEQVIRGIAVEGILKSPHREIAEKALTHISGKSPDRFVVDRSKRALHYLKNGGLSPEQQDLAALEALLKSPL